VSPDDGVERDEVGLVVGGGDGGRPAARPPTEEERRRALARVRSLLRDLGTTDEEIRRAVDDDVVDLLVVDRMLIPAERRYTQIEIAELTGISIDLARRVWRALGFLDVADDERAFTEMDIEAIRLFQGMVSMGIVDVDTALQMARVIGSSMARIAEAETAPGSTPIVVPTGDSVVDADQFAQLAGASLPTMARLLEFVWRRHVQAATRRAMLIRSRTGPEGISPTLAVGFADMVGFTVLSQHLAEAELAAVVSRFEQLAHDTVTALGGRVVKMIGDEAMFVVQTVPDAARIGLSLAEAYADDDLLSDVRVGLAVGPVLVQDGDFYGPVVNLASRMVNIANPGTVLMSEEFHADLTAEAPEEFASRALRPRNLKGMGRVQLWRLSRADTEQSADRRRGARWERLGEVLRELDDLRDRGERLLVERGRAGEGTPADAEGSGAVEPDGGDGLGPEGERSVELVEGPTP
jgi:adenylate cyclase